MNKLDVVKFLVAEIAYEEEIIKIYDTDMKQAREKAKKVDGYSWNFREYEGRKPSRERIKNNCKKIRQLMLEISKEKTEI